MGYAFISYSSKNQQMADSFRALFHRNGIKTWMAPGDIPFGSTYTATINRAIREASCFVLLLSESAQGSQWVLKETERAVSYGKTIFTILLDDVPMNDSFEFMLSTSQAVAIRKIDEKDEEIKKLIQAIKAYTSEELPVKQKQGNATDKSKSFFEENATMEGSVLKKFNTKVEASVDIPEGVTVIGSEAFVYSPIKGISIPSTVTRIDECAFIKSQNLQSITVFPDNPVFRSENNCCIERGTNRLVFGCGKSIIPEGVTVISRHAFNGCKNLEEIDLPSNIVKIGVGAFYDCVNLKEVHIQEGVVEIGGWAFGNCRNLTEIKIPASVTKIADDAFLWCENLQSIRVSNQNLVYYSKNNSCIERKSNRLVFGCEKKHYLRGLFSRRIN